MEWEKKELTFQCLAMEDFARYFQSRQGVSEGFEERRDVPQAGTPAPNRKTVKRKGHGKSLKPVTMSLVEQLEEGKSLKKS